MLYNGEIAVKSKPDIGSTFTQRSQQPQSSAMNRSEILAVRIRQTEGEGPGTSANYEARRQHRFSFIEVNMSGMPAVEIESGAVDFIDDGYLTGLLSGPPPEREGSGTLLQKSLAKTGAHR